MLEIINLLVYKYPIGRYIPKIQLAQASELKSKSLNYKNENGGRRI